jgi:ubiquinone/menaquinone biosynthesis C-methylase UbiE
VTGGDAVFAGSIPALYDRHLGDMLFAPYADHLAKHVVAQNPKNVLEIAAGTGIVTRALHAALPSATIVATDLNDGMLAHAATRLEAANVTWRQADAMSLPFGDAAFDLVVCQFGVMFFPDRVAAFREARRVLAPGGRYAFTMWASIEYSPLADLVARAAAHAFPNDPPSFLTRTPYGHGDPAVTEAELRAAGFTQVKTTTVDAPSRASSAFDPAIGFCQGTPLRSEIESRDPARLADVTESAARAVAARYGDGPIEATMRAFVFDARSS